MAEPQEGVQLAEGQPVEARLVVVEQLVAERQVVGLPGVGQLVQEGYSHQEEHLEHQGLAAGRKVAPGQVVDEPILVVVEAHKLADLAHQELSAVQMAMVVQRSRQLGSAGSCLGSKQKRQPRCYP